MFRQLLLIVIASSGWLALAGQFYLIIHYRQAPLGETILQYFSYFSILTNLLVSSTCTYLYWNPHLKTKTFSIRTSLLTATLVYITIVGLVYNLVLRSQWDPQGSQLIITELLHSIIPILFFLYWLAFVDKNDLTWKRVLTWLLFPAIYLLYVLTRGALSGIYPYPNIDVAIVGFRTALFNTAVVAMAFIFFSFLYVGLARIMGKNY